MNQEEKINPADIAKRVVKLTADYEADKAELESTIKKKEAVIVDITETNRQRGNKISSLEKELEEERLENRRIRQVESEKKETKEQKSFLEEFERLKNQKKQANIK